MKSQNEKVKQILEREGSISNYWAIENKLTYRLGARIHDLRKQGMSIRTAVLENKDTVYSLI